METKGERIRDCMREKGISQQQLAKELGVYPSAVAKWLANENQPSDEYLVKMAKIFSVQATWLDWGTTVLTDDADEVAKKYANLSERDQKVIDSVMDSLVKTETPKKNGNDKK